MANSIIFISLIQLLLSFLSLSCYCNGNPQNLETNGLSNNANTNAAVVVVVNGSLVPQTITSTVNMDANANANRGRRRQLSAVVMNRWSRVDKKDMPTQEQIHEWDAQRARAIQAQLVGPRNAVTVTNGPSAKVDALPGFLINSANFVVEVGIGKPSLPQAKQFLIFDTGSALTWVQCKACEPSCFKENSTIFDPKLSGSQIIECTLPECKTLKHYEPTSCKNNKVPRGQCGFKISYEDKSSVSGSFFKDKLTLGKLVVSNNYIFGCANRYENGEKTAFQGSSGILGLQGGNPVSIVSQADKQFRGVFSYCLPSGYNRGHLTFGSFKDAKSRFKSTLPILANKESEYLAALVGITVGATRLKIPPTVFSKGALIDTGTVKTFLPKTAYNKLQEEFMKQMGKYSKVNGTNNACYNLKAYPNARQIPIPKITLHFEASGNEQTFQLSNDGVMGGPWHQRCLWFASFESDDGLSIIGGFAQQTFDFMFDFNQKKILIGNQGCK